MLTGACGMVYSGGALAKSSAGIHKPNYTSANGRSSEASFFTPKFYDGLIRGAASARRVSSCIGIVNSVKPVTLLLHNNGGSSQNEHEDTTMSNDPARIEKAVHLFSQLSPEKQFIYLSIFQNPKLLEILANLPSDHAAVISEHMGALLFGEVCH